MGKVYIRMRAYNAEKTLRRAIKSVLNQTYRDFIFYICDNGSSDRTKKIIDFYAQKDNRIVPFYNKINMIFDESSVTFRDLPRHIEADDCYCTLDADDEYLPTFLEDMLLFMEKNNLDIACCGTEMFQVDEKQNRRPAGNRILPEALVLDNKHFAVYYPYYHCFMRPIWAKLFKGSTVFDMVTDPSQVPNWPRAYGGDTVSSFQALRHAKRMGVLNKVLHRYYIMPKSVSSQFSPNRVDCDPILFEDAVDFLGRYGPISTENYNFLYAVYTNALIDTFRVIVQSQSCPEEKIRAVIAMCRCAYTIQLAAWENFDESMKEHRDRLFSGIVQWMLTLEEVPDELAEDFFDCGEMAAAAARLAEEWVTFKKLKITFLLQSQREEEAQIKISELDELNRQCGEVTERREVSQKSAAGLDSETDLGNYLDMLIRNRDQYRIFIAVRDTPWGNNFTPVLTGKLTALGLKTNLFGKFRYAYAAVVDQGKRVFEEISPDRSRPVTWSGKLGELAVHLESRGFEVPPSKASIELDGQEHSVSLRGLNFVVCDKNTNHVIDSVNFDTWSEMLTCTRPNVLSTELVKWHHAHPEIGLLCFNKPDFPTSNLTENEKFIVENVHSQGDSYRLIDNPHLPLRLFFDSKEEIFEVITPPKSYHDIAGVRRFCDMQGRHVCTIAGHRITTDQPGSVKRTIYMVGGCSTFGIGASDRNTIASWLQRICNVHIPQEEILVENYGYYLSDGDRENMEELKILNALPVKPGDIVLCDWGFSNEIPLLDLKTEGERPHKHGEIFFDMGPLSGHLTENGYRLTAEKIFEHLTNEGFFTSSDRYMPVQPQETPSIHISYQNDVMHKDLEIYKDKLSALYSANFSVGAIVMNCNPFTLGHRYLVEQALAQCAHLVVFIVEEDRSCFSFLDRIQLVQDGLADLKNVTILPSGKFVLSSLTFTEYFNKSELQNQEVDPSYDVYIFATEIAPCLHITKRFVGNEPSDTVTQQYNCELKKMLPRYGIDVIEFQRQTDGQGIPISASKVREYIKAQNLLAMKPLLPISTYSYVESHLQELSNIL